jgi:hypothetical protein
MTFLGSVVSDCSIVDHRWGESHTLRGVVDRPALCEIRDEIDRLEPLATPELNDGLREADAARIDVRWTTRDDYAFHYTDLTGVDLRWGSHPHGGDYVRVTDTEHYHPPPDARSDPNTVDDSCVAVSPAVLVTRAVLKLWRVAYHHGSLAALNAGENPP